MNILQRLKDGNRLKLVSIIAISCMFSILLSAYRIYHTHTIIYGFYWWNLFLAFIPYTIGALLFINSRTKKISGLLLLMIISLWLLFFPNSPYLITDMLHLRPRTDMPFWYDVLMSVSFAWNGIVLGLLSLSDIQQVISERTNNRVGWLFSAFAICLGSFGIYLGRFERWNSWDIITNPFNLAFDIVHQLVHPFSHPRPFAVTLLFSVFMGIAYITMKLLNSTIAVSKR